MLVIVGAVIVIGCVLGGFMAHGGNVLVLNQPTEFLVIFGAAAGAFVIQSPMPVIKETVKQVLGTLKGKDITKAEYMQVLLCIYELTKLAKQNLLGLEPHVENPSGSEIFQRYPYVLNNHHAVHFICDTLKVQISSPLNPFDLEELMESDIQAAHAEEGEAPSTIARTADAMPGLGIVAAVLGVIITMGKLNEGKESIGHSVAAALVGTFIGVLMAYGFMSPLSQKMTALLNSNGKVLDVIKVGLLAFAKDASPKVCVEFSRRTIPPHVRPTFEEVDAAASGAGKAAA